MGWNRGSLLLHLTATALLPSRDPAHRTCQPRRSIGKGGSLIPFAPFRLVILNRLKHGGHGERRRRDVACIFDLSAASVTSEVNDLKSSRSRDAIASTRDARPRRGDSALPNPAFCFRQIGLVNLEANESLHAAFLCC
jgi:hypothetical protein